MAIFRTAAVAAIAAATLFAQYKTEPAGAPPAEVSALAAALAPQGIKISKPDGSELLTLWLAAKAPTGAPVEQNVTLPGVPHGVLLGVASYPKRASDRRGQQIKPGVYTLRYSYYPMNGDHQGAAPQRDFLLLSPAAIDTDPAAKPAFDPLMDMSRKASGTPHPLVLSIWKDDSGAAAGIEAVGEFDQVVHAKIGDLPVSIIVVGKAEG